MAKSPKPATVTSNSQPHESPVKPATGVIVTKQDKAVWAECANRLILDPKDRRLRYFHVGGHGITVVYKTGGEKTAPWLYPSPQTVA